MDYDTDEDEDLDLVEIRAGDVPVSWAGISASGVIYLQGDIHPLGSYSALLKAAKEQVPYVAVSTVQVLYPSDWLRAECLGDADRLRIIANLEAQLRGRK